MNIIVMLLLGGIAWTQGNPDATGSTSGNNNRGVIIVDIIGA